MEVSRRSGPVRRLVAATALVVAVSIPTAPVTLAADPILPRPSATVVFLETIDFEGTATFEDDVVRLEIVIDVEGSERSFIADLPFDTAGSDFGYSFTTTGGSLLPNTDVTAAFRVTLADGRTVSGPSVSVRYDDTRLDWAVRSGEFVTVRWTAGGSAFGRRALQIADDAVRDVTHLLGVTESEPIDFYIYASNDDFYDVIGPGARENVGGEAHPDIRTLFAQISAAQIDHPWVGTVIPHELTHLVFDTAVANPYHYPSRWLNEGIAVYLSEGYTPGDQRAVESAVSSGALMPLTALEGQFPTAGAKFGLAYAESASAVEFLVREYGQPALVALVRSYAGGVTDDEAFEAALGVDVAGFEAAWLADLGAEAPEPYGPLNAPPGPVPPDWIGGGEVPGPVETASSGATPRPTVSTPDQRGDGDATAIFASLLVAGLAAAAAGIWLGRRRQAAQHAAAVARVVPLVAPPPDPSAAAPPTEPAPPTTPSGAPDGPEAPPDGPRP